LISKQRDFLQDCFQHNPVSEGDGDSKKSLVADLYLSETLNLDKTIRSLTQGYGQLLSSFEGYSPLPKDAAKKTIASIRGF
jgi:translation elongation factor EF-G